MVTNETQTTPTKPVDKLDPTYLKFYQKLNKVKQNAPPIVKDTDSYHGKFAPLPKIVEEIDPLMEEYKLHYQWVLRGNMVVFRVICLESGCYDETYLFLGDDFADFQDVGGQLTFYSRYLLMLFFGFVAQDDDDGGDGKRKKRRTRTDKIEEDDEEEDYDDDDDDDDDEDDDRTTSRRGSRSRRSGTPTGGRRNRRRGR